MAELREDLLKLAHKFLSSPKVQAASKEKKVAFLKSKGLTDDEVAVAFDRVGETPPASTTTTTTATASTPSVPSSSVASATDASSTASSSKEATDAASASSTTTTHSPVKSTTPSAVASVHQEPSEPVFTRYTPPPASSIPQPPLKPVIVYQPAPEQPKVPTQQVLAMAVIFGVGITGVASGLIGIVKRFLYPVFITFGSYRRSRYSHQKQLLEKVQKALASDIKEEKDQDELDALDKPGVYALVEKQSTITNRLTVLIDKTKSYTPSAKNSLIDVHQSLSTWSEALDDEAPVTNPSAKELMTELRSFKGICLNRRF
ncbi:hypothetical protein DM01DRAFT_1381598 [Hesseltinella vesiculosa]|uniref:Peroxisomal membrane protein PEX14 n=1 Tax=Hesseltinella vesiculosa TaxID=101127 RepID=A0A1X2GQF0_9FUNG|nr:hypothetical protein DM01DRAFT_1381598 [Hesseltinella vesiculosa]